MNPTDPTDQLRIYELVGSALNRRRGESLANAAARYVRRRPHRPGCTVARRVLAIGDKRGAAAWAELAAAAELARARLVPVRLLSCER
jgi:hypothetical protein